MINVFWALGFIALGMALSETYNRRIWRKYREGLQDARPVPARATYSRGVQHHE